MAENTDIFDGMSKVCDGVFSMGCKMGDYFVEVIRNAMPVGTFHVVFREASTDQVKAIIKNVCSFDLDNISLSGVASALAIMPTLTEMVKAYAKAEDAKGLYDALTSHGLIGDHSADVAGLNSKHFAKIAAFNGLDEIKAFFGDRFGDDDSVVALFDGGGTAGSSSVASVAKKVEPPPPPPTLLDRLKGVAEAENVDNLYNLLVEFGMGSDTPKDEFVSLKKGHFMKIAAFTTLGDIQSFFSDRIGDDKCLVNLVNVKGTFPGTGAASAQKPAEIAKKPAPSKMDENAVAWQPSDDKESAFLGEFVKVDKMGDAYALFVKYGCALDKSVMLKTALKFKAVAPQLAMKNINVPKCITEADDSTLAKLAGRCFNKLSGGKEE